MDEGFPTAGSAPGMDRTRRSILCHGVAAAALLTSPDWLFARATEDRLFTPEMFGAKGDGRTNDSAAFGALSDAVNANGGGTVRFRRRTYLVGAQRPTNEDRTYLFEPAKLLEFIDCHKPLTIEGNGARLRCSDGLRYGIFKASGEPLRHPMPYIGPGAASPYRAMLKVERCSGTIRISDLELDGRLGQLQIGGQYGDTGWQLPASGMHFVNNSGDEIVRNIHSHHHALDGLIIDGSDTVAKAGVRREFSHIRSEYNARQGCSMVGGRDYHFDHCRFNHTGKAGLVSAPAAGFDIEAEGGKVIRNLEFSRCEFSNNSGCGLVADNGDSQGARFSDCSFVGTTSWSAWPGKPNFRFHACSFLGAFTHAFGDKDPERATQFVDCTFHDDPSKSPTGEVYGGANLDRPMGDLSDSENVLFKRCIFIALHNAVLPWSTGAIYEDCVMRQRSSRQSYPRGTFRGRTIVSGNVDLYGSRFLGEVTVNGERRRPSSF